MAEDTRRRSTINVARLTMWKMTGDTSAATTYKETPYTWENSLAAVKYTPKMQTNEQYGGSVTLHPKRFAVLDCEIAKISLTSYVGVPLFALTFTRATRSEKGTASRCFGETDKNGTEVSGADDIVPSVATAYYTKRPDGKINLYKFPKTKFMPEGEDSKQKEGSNISYGTANLKGTYSPLLSSKADCYKRYGVDPVKDAAIIEKWFTEAAYHAPEDDTQNTQGEDTGG